MSSWGTSAGSSRPGIPGVPSWDFTLFPPASLLSPSNGAALGRKSFVGVDFLAGIWGGRFSLFPFLSVV